MPSLSEFVLNYVLNATWQIVAIAAVAMLGSLLLRNAPARYRHVLWLAALASCVVVPLLTTTHAIPATDTIPPDQSALIAAAAPHAPPLASTTVNPEPDLSVFHLTKRRARTVNTGSTTTLWLTIAYALFLLWRASTLVRFWYRKEKLKRSIDLEDLTPEAERVARRCRAIFAIRRVNFAQSSSARVPYTIGAQRPLIVLPKVFCVASEERLLSVIGHEMAHVGRRDYLTNLFCELALLPISFHPLAFVIKRQIDRSRELACDELVSKLLLPPRLYARSLVWAADISSQARSQALVLSMFDARSLEERIMRLTRNRKMLSLRSAKAITSMMLIALCAAAISLSLFSLELKTEARTVFTSRAPVEVSHNNPPVLHAGTTITERLRGMLASRAPAPASNVNTPVSQPETITTQHPRTEAQPAVIPANDLNAEQRAKAACDAGRNGDTEQIPALIALLADDTRTEHLRCWSTGRWSPALDTFKHPSPGEQAAIALASMGRAAFLPLRSKATNSSLVDKDAQN